MAWTNPVGAVLVVRTLSSMSLSSSIAAQLLILAIVSNAAEAIGTAAISAHKSTIVKAGSSSSSSSGAIMQSSPDDSDPNSSSSVERYYFEHMISEKEASAAFESMVEALIDST